jgi:hypothetical protein
MAATQRCPRLPRAEGRDSCPSGAVHKPNVASGARSDPGGRHVYFRMSERDYEQEPVADKAPVTDLSATEIDEVASRNSLRSVVRGVVELQCIM